MTTPSERFRPGVTVILVPAVARTGALLRAGELDRATFLGAVDQMYPTTPPHQSRSED